MERFINRFDGLYAVAAKIMGGVFQVRPGISKCANRFPDFGMGFRQGCGCCRWLWGCCRNCGCLGRRWGSRHRQAERQCKDYQGGKTQHFQFHRMLHDIQDFLAGSRIAPRGCYFNARRVARNAWNRGFVACVHNSFVASAPSSFVLSLRQNSDSSRMPGMRPRPLSSLFIGARIRLL